MNYSPKDPKFVNRDRFILSNGHASALQYSMIHLTGYDLPMAELEKFRKLHSMCPGHPENFVTPGVEVTTGPLGQGISNAVGMALGRAHLAACFNRPGFSLFDHSVYCICGDGCLMEGMSSEACALAGLLALPNLVVLWDDNNISIDGSTEIAFTEDVTKRFEAHGWEVSHVEDGDTDNEAIFAAVLRARAAGRPSLIRVSTTIGFGSAKAATHHVHGAPLAVDDLQQLRKASGFPEDKGFFVPKKVGDFYQEKGRAGDTAAAGWSARLEKYGSKYPEEHRQLARRLGVVMVEPAWEAILGDAMQLPIEHDDLLLSALISELPQMMGGSVSGAPPLRFNSAFTFQERRGRHVDFGPREHAGAAACNGLAAYGGFIPFFRCPASEILNAWGSIRLSALSLFGVLYVATCDGRGADEITTLCRATPNLALFRPADAKEVAAAYKVALTNRSRPTLVVLPPPGSPPLSDSSMSLAEKGGYVLLSSVETPTIVLVTSGTQVAACCEAHALLTSEGFQVRVVSVPCWEVFDEQSEDYIMTVMGRPHLKHASKSAPLSARPAIFVEVGAAVGFERFGSVHLGSYSEEHQPEAIANRVRQMRTASHCGA